MENLWIFLTVAGVYLMAAVSPGPNFLVVVKNSIGVNRQVGLATAAAIGTGAVTYCLLSFWGLSALLASTPEVIWVIRILGGSYLVWMGYKMLRAKQRGDFSLEVEGNLPKISLWKGYREGLLTTFSNPKAFIFFTSLFTLVIDPSTPTALQLELIAMIGFLSWGWYSLVAVMFSQQSVKRVYLRFELWISRFVGGFLSLLGIKVILVM